MSAAVILSVADPRGNSFQVEMVMEIQEAARAAKKAAVSLAAAGTGRKNQALGAIADALSQRREEIIRANRADLARSEAENLAAPLIKRLKFDEAKIGEAVAGLRSLSGLPDPVGQIQAARELDDDLVLYQVSCPIGVIGVIFESRPDALVQISTLCLKSGNSVLLKGGSEARETNRILAEIVTEASRQAGIENGWLHLLETRADVRDLLGLDDLVDLIIPRGSNAFVRHIMANSRIPVLGHADGICHCYVDKGADLQMAQAVVIDSKTQYVAVCNALETLLVHEDVAGDLLPSLGEALEARGVQLCGCEKSAALIPMAAATEADWRTEYLDLKLSVKVVSDLDAAIDHINTYGSGHTDAIVTESRENARRFMNRVDSGNVLWNCSTRFSDGFRYGLGAEVGISTNKIHARGPVGLEGLVIYKYKLIGKGQVVADYAGGKRHFSHRELEPGAAGKGHGV